MNAPWMVGLGAMAVLAAPVCGTPRIPNDFGSAVRGAEDASRTAEQAGRDARMVKDISQDAQGLQEAQGRCRDLGRAPIAIDEERPLGEAAAIRIAQKHGGLLSGPEHEGLVKYVNKVGRVLADRSERPGLQWIFGVLDDDAANAYALPGGIIFVTRGLLQKVENEAQLAGVLSHEIGHVTGLHALRHYRAYKEARCNQALAASSAGKAADLGNNVFASALDSRGAFGFIDFGRSVELLADASSDLATTLETEKTDPTAEKQADRDGLALMVLTGYQPGEYSRLLQALPTGYQTQTHPPKKERVASVESTLKSFAKEDDPRAAGAPYGRTEGYIAPPLRVKLSQK